MVYVRKFVLLRHTFQVFFLFMFSFLLIKQMNVKANTHTHTYKEDINYIFLLEDK